MELKYFIAMESLLTFAAVSHGWNYDYLDEYNTFTLPVLYIEKYRREHKQSSITLALAEWLDKKFKSYSDKELNDYIKSVEKSNEINEKLKKFKEPSQC